MMKYVLFTLVGLASLFSANSLAERFAITNALVHTLTEQGVLANATVVVEDGVISEINPSSLNVDKVIDAQGKILTPGLIGSMNQLGLDEVSAVATTQDAADKDADISFDPSLAFNAKSSVIPYSRKGGVTTNFVIPKGGKGIFKGQGFITDLTGSYSSIVSANHGVVVDLGAKSKGSRALSLQKLALKLEKLQEKLAANNSEQESADEKKAQSDKNDKLKADEKILQAVLSGEKTLFAHADRASDMLELIRLKQVYKFSLVIIGAADALKITEQLTAADVTVAISGIRNLPSFEGLHTSLQTSAELARSGVKFLIHVNGDTHNLYQLRFNAGIAVANGLPFEQALAAVTANVADVLNLDAGRIKVGNRADLVLWSGDPLELSSKVEQMWIKGQPHSTLSRHDKLRDRYKQQSEMPKAYLR